MNTHHNSPGKSRNLRIFTLSACVLALSACLFPQKAEAQADVAVSFQFFQDSLQPYGTWVDVERYGPCWVPDTYADDWRPYSDGSWAYTECGWTWVSDEPWGWATYHYGRWVYLDGPGWAWVPGYEWGPAWVAWRSSDDYIGWAPLPPEAVWEPRSGFSVSVNFNFGPSYYNFCEVRNFGSRRLRDVICRRERNVTIINNTVNVTRFSRNNSLIVNEGPDFASVNRRSERNIERVRLERHADVNGIEREERHGDRLEVFAPNARATERTGNRERTERRVSQVQVDRSRNVGDVTSRRNAERNVAVERDRSSEINAAPPARQTNRRHFESRSGEERGQARAIEPSVQAPVSDRIVQQEKPAVRERAPQVQEQKREPRVRAETPRAQESRQQRAVEQAPAPERQHERPAEAREFKRESPKPVDQQPPTMEELTEKKRHGR